MRPLGGGRFLFEVGWRAAAFIGLSLAGPWIASTIQTASACRNEQAGCVAISAATGVLLRPLVLFILALALLRPCWRRARTVGLRGAAGLLVPLLLILDWRVLTVFGPSYAPVSFERGLLNSGFPFFSLLALVIVVTLAAAPTAVPGDSLSRRQGVLGKLGWIAAAAAALAGVAATVLHLAWLAEVAELGPIAASPAFMRSLEAARLAHIVALAAAALLVLAFPAGLFRSPPPAPAAP